MFCNKCGAEIAPGNSVCQNCGAPVATHAQSPASNTQPATGKGNGGNNKMLIIIISIAAALILIIGGVFAFLYFNKDKDDKDESSGKKNSSVSETISSEDEDEDEDEKETVAKSKKQEDKDEGNNDEDEAKSVAKKFVQSYLGGKMKDSLNCTIADAGILEKRWKDVAKENGKDLDEIFDSLGAMFDAEINNMNDFWDAFDKSAKEQLESEYDINSVSVKVDDIEEADEDDLQEMQETLDADDTVNQYLSGSKIKKAYKVDLTASLGSDGESLSVLAVKYGSSWKIFFAPSTPDNDLSEGFSGFFTLG